MTINYDYDFEIASMLIIAEGDVKLAAERLQVDLIDLLKWQIWNQDAVTELRMKYAKDLYIQSLIDMRQEWIENAKTAHDTVRLLDGEHLPDTTFVSNQDNRVLKIVYDEGRDNGQLSNGHNDFLTYGNGNGNGTDGRG